MPARRIQPIDTTGAGDAYVGAFMVSHLLKGEPLHKAMAFATDCAAYACVGLGARHTANHAQLKAFLGGER